jgi:hypothetical protein
MELVLNSLKQGQTRMIFDGNKILIKPFPFAHVSIQHFFNDIDFKNMKTDLELIVTILYEAYTPGGGNTTALYLTSTINTNEDFIFLILQNIKRQISNLKLEFKCIIKCTLSHKRV